MGVLFAGGLPGVLSYRRIRNQDTPQREVAFPRDKDDDGDVVKPQWVSEKADTALSWMRRNRSCLAILLLDLNQFQRVNAAYGRSAGDELLQAFAMRLKAAIRAEDMVERLGGDEFVILQADPAQPGGARALASRLMKSLSEPYQLGTVKVVCGASLGVAIAPADGTEWEALLSRADVALHRAKAEGIDTACFFDPEMDAAFRKHRRLEAEMIRALDQQIFQLAFQPLIEGSKNTLIGFETFLRWPSRWEQQSPAAFLPVAEESGLIVPLGNWALQTACTWAAAWVSPLKVSVNLSPVQLRRGDIVNAVKQALKKSGLDASRLELEVTESSWAQDTEDVQEQLRRLQALGVSLVLDGFGTGDSSLTCLTKIPFNGVKIDRSLVSAMECDPKALAMVKSIAAMCRNLDLTVTAVGVETQAQAEILIAAGCDRMQGYLCGRPLSATAPVLY